jgi:O-methyltransferase domain
MTEISTDPSSRLRELGNLLPGYAIRAAATLRIPDFIEEGLVDSHAIAVRAKATESGVRALLHYLAGIGVLTVTGPDRFALTDIGARLCSDHPESQRDVYDTEHGRARAEVFWGLLDSLRSGEPAFPAVHGRTFWEDLDEHPGLAEHWATMFAHHAEPLGRTLAKTYDWSECQDVADLGGGTGVMLAALLEEHPSLRGILVDLETTAVLAQALFEERGLTSQASVRAQSFFEPLPVADVYLLSWILHDWPDDQATAILANCAAAAKPTSRILVVEQMFESDDVARGVASMHLLMLMLYGGRERSRQDFDRLADPAGLVRIAEHALGDGFLALEYRTVSAAR